MPLFLFIFHIFTMYIHSLITFIQHICPSPFAEASLHLFIALKLSGKASLWCWAENRTRACLTASRRSTNWATPHHLSNAAPSEQRRTIFFFFLNTYSCDWSTAFYEECNSSVIANPVPRLHRTARFKHLKYSYLLVHDNTSPFFRTLPAQVRKVLLHDFRNYNGKFSFLPVKHPWNR